MKEGYKMHRLYELSRSNMFLHTNVNMDGTVHFHDEIKLAYVTGGKLDVVVDDIEYTLEPDTLLIVYPRQIHKFQSNDNSDDSSIMFLFDPAVLPEMTDAFSAFIPKTACSTDKQFNRQLLPILELITKPQYSEGEEGEKYDCVAARGGLLAVVKLLSNKLGLTPIAAPDDVMYRMLEYCNSHYRDRLTLEEMEAEFHLNGCYISTIFTKKLGIGFHEYVNSLRLSDACKLLTSTDESITSIAYIVGFSTSRTFNRVFLESLGMPPRDYRRKFTQQ